MKVVCEHCALPFTVARVAPGRPVYCCSGCALASRLPVGVNGHFPVNAALVVALGVGFVCFNQILFWLLAVLLARTPAGLVNADSFTWASLGVGIAVWGALGIFQSRAGARRGLDTVVLLGTALVIACGVLTLSPVIAVAGNAVFAVWALRGLARKRVR